MSRSFLIDMHYTKFVDCDLLDLAYKDINQLQQIMRLTGTPPASLISRMPSHEVSSLWPSPLFAEYPSCPLISRPYDVSHLVDLKKKVYQHIKSNITHLRVMLHGPGNVKHSHVLCNHSTLGCLFSFFPLTVKRNPGLSVPEENTVTLTSKNLFHLQHYILCS